MIWKIAKKEFLLNLVSARFSIGFLLCLFLIPFTVTVNVDDYDKRLWVYRMSKANAEKIFKEVRVYSYLRPEIVKPLQPQSVMNSMTFEAEQAESRTFLSQATTPFKQALPQPNTL